MSEVHAILVELPAGQIPRGGRLRGVLKDMLRRHDVHCVGMMRLTAPRIAGLNSVPVRIRPDVHRIGEPDKFVRIWPRRNWGKGPGIPPRTYLPTESPAVQIELRQKSRECQK